MNPMFMKMLGQKAQGIDPLMQVLQAKAMGGVAPPMGGIPPAGNIAPMDSSGGPPKMGIAPVDPTGGMGGSPMGGNTPATTGSPMGVPPMRKRPKNFGGGSFGR